MEHCFAMEKKRSAISAVLLSIAAPGLGHIYCGSLAWGVLFLLLSFLHWAVFLVLWAGAHSSLEPALTGWMVTSGLVWLGAAVHSAALTRRTADGFTLKAYNLWYLYVLVMVSSWSAHYGMLKLLGANWLTAVELKSDGMIPGLLVGDTVRVDLRSETIKNVKRGTVVVVLDPYDGETWRVLRVVGVGGDEVRLDEHGLAINEKPLLRTTEGTGEYMRQDENGGWVEQRFARCVEKIGDRTVTVAEQLDPARRRHGSWQVPSDKIFVLGDNRIRAIDSSMFGPVDATSVKGVVFKIWFSKDPRTSKRRVHRQGMAVY